MSSKEHVIEAALKLSEEERLEIAERLYESVEEPVDAEADEAWDREIKRRLKLVDEGKAKFLTWEEARRLITEGGDGGKNP
ncbi:MAG TPA: addiction module protein [Tepidisphaeraceae bacterium]|nr:addiction module protein [Tepidisphaeraceae bacterium]